MAPHQNQAKAPQGLLASPQAYPPPNSDTPGTALPQNPTAPLLARNRERKRSREPEDPLRLPTKRRRTSLASAAVESSAVEATPDQELLNRVYENDINPINYWIQRGHWPKLYFRQDNMDSLLARKKSSSFHRKQSESGSVSTPNDQKPRDEKSAPYRNSRYQTVLESKGSFMKKARVGITDGSSTLIESLLDTVPTVPENSLFRDDLFDTTCEKIQCENEARVIRDIGLLIVPSADTLASYGATHLECLDEGVNKGWNNSIPFCGPRPQPDYSVGFKRSAFTDDQLEKLKPFIGDWECTSFFMATDTMHFPFLTCEVKCGEVALDIADRQNAHSMTLAVRGVVELFKLVKREKEVDREILAFSVSHDHTAVRIYGYYAVLEGEKTNFYRHPIHKFDFTALDGKEKWTTYRFTRNVYDIWMPSHFKRICSAIDQIPPDVDFDVSQSGQYSQQSNSGSVLAVEDDDSQPSQRHIASAGVTPTTSFTEQTQIFKRPRKKQ
ncbi:conserved hypothetical protein [Histoplasma mississippiense (nom. inval.)]|uniref:conserved hypothetical protein n=1 Tax=Ajellomyces capsulatus (strain NAm1 / WU24) TaxID=2059318 RepID=UPI000157B625|nr:conserved hypothetical protein [Histoplasma mississippiense (nom. inval.)]EDN02438.1 conserved hypothetical protein [Histoplasma mississippiense (nom. inval.)]